MSVVIFTPLPLYPRGKEPPVPIGEEVWWIITSIDLREAW
jgi:hypothetical protein